MSEPTPQTVNFGVRDGLIRAEFDGVPISLSGDEASALITALMVLKATGKVRDIR